MNPSDPTPSQGTSRDFDGLLRSFFRAEMPSPWPGWQRPAVPSPRPTVLRRQPLTRSRVALAAGLLILLTGYAGLADHAAEPASVLDSPSDSARRTRSVKRPKSASPAQQPPAPVKEEWLLDPGS